MKEITYYGISINNDSKQIVLWKNINDSKIITTDNDASIETSMGLKKFPKERVFKVSSKKAYKVVLDYIEKMKKEVPEWKDYSVTDY